MSSGVAKALEKLEDLGTEYAASGALAEAELEVASAVTAKQFVIFHVQKEMFAVALTDVREIIRMPDVVQVPMSPPELEGIANLRGTVLPILNLRRTFAFAEVMHDDATRVVVLNHARAVGLIVDRMANVVAVEAERIEPAAAIRATVDTDLVSGIIKATDGSSIVMILDTKQLVEREFQSLSSRPDTRSSAGLSERSAEQSNIAAGVVEDDQFVSFELAGQEYAFPIERVKEIVHLPNEISRVPKSSSHILGMITLRNQLLPLVSLREKFGFPVKDVSDANRVAVISIGRNGTIPVGVVMDSVKEVLRVSKSAIDPLPSILAQGSSLRDVQGVCRLDDGRRLVSILSVDTMFDASDILAAMKPDHAKQENGDNNAEAALDIESEEQFVVFKLLGEEYGVPIDAVQEIVRVPGELTKVPKTPDYIEGVINLRGIVMPVVDQRRRFSLNSAERNDRQRIMVFTVGGVRTGFIVDSVSEVMRIPAVAIGPSPELSHEQKRIIRRVANLEKEKRMILLLEVSQLLNVEEITDLKAAVH